MYFFFELYEEGCDVASRKSCFKDSSKTCFDVFGASPKFMPDHVIYDFSRHSGLNSR